MKAIFLTLTLSISLLVPRLSVAQETAPIEGTKARLSYSAGVKLTDYFRHSKDLIDLDILVRGVRDAFEENGLSMEKGDIEDTFAGFQRTVLDNQRIKEEVVFLAKNGRAEGVVVLPSGLQYKIVREGSGPTPAANDRVKTRYRGTLIDGTEFDNSYEPNEPTIFGVDQIIPGWAEALRLMPVGSKWQIFIPSALAYGAQGAGKKIPPHSTLIFEIDLLEIVIDPMKNFR